MSDNLGDQLSDYEFVVPRRRRSQSSAIFGLEETPRQVVVEPSVRSHQIYMRMLANISGTRNVGLEDLLEVGLAKAGPMSIVLVFSHTLYLPLERVVPLLFALKGKRAKVGFWAFDDAHMARFSEDSQGIGMDKQALVRRMEEMGIAFELIDPRSLVSANIDRSRRGLKG